MLRHYEIAVIFQPELEEAALAAQTERVEELISANGGSIVRTDRWGKRRLAYEIRKKREGYYVFWYAALPAAAPREIERNLRLSEDVLRFMLTRLEHAPEAPAESTPDTTEAAAPDTADAAAPDTADAAAPDTADAAAPETADAAAPETADAAAPDTADAAAPGTADAAAPDTDEVAVPDTAEATVSESADAAPPPGDEPATVVAEAEEVDDAENDGDDKSEGQL
ncbi:MAG: 30S ribosomal protein S6 [Anaerolineales bacterium]